MTMSQSDPRRGEIWLVDFDPSVGEEQRKTRPALVLSVEAVGKLQLRIVVPITGWQDRFEQIPWFTRLQSSTSTGLTKESGADAFQVKSVSLERFSHRLGEVGADELENVVAGVALCIGFALTPR